MTDILERLRDTRTGKTTSPDWPYKLLQDAADEIERLREALQWAIKDCDAKTNHESIKRELLEALGEKE
jgi:hypothetical protein